MLAALSGGAIVITTEPLTIPLLHRVAAIALPGQRSPDTIPTPPGCALVPLGLLVATVLIHCAVSAPFLLATAGFSAVGLAEDLRGLPIRGRIGLQGAASGRAISCRRLRRAGSALRRVLDRACGKVLHGISWGRRRPRCGKSRGTATQPHLHHRRRGSPSSLAVTLLRI